ncbi:MAG: Gfo/Idh/MocA family oxidoreductase [Chitinophagaceae bacterium]|nr:MAG: Gfo/Idh/MocA family oxidoreductase [Chitinophagaceae bacterium]
MKQHQKKILIIGCGNIGSRHIMHASKLADIIGVCDINKEKANQFAEQYNTKAFYDIQSALESCSNIDLVSICTPNGLHAEHSILALENGAHVLCEKPMAISTISATKMIETAQSYQKKLYVVKQNRYNPPIEYLKNLIEKKALGNIYSFQVNGYWNRPAAYYKGWKGTLSLDGGTLYTQFSHFIDLILWLFGDAKNAQLIRKNFCHPSIEFEDTGIISFEMQNGMIGSFNYTVNSYHKNMEGSITVFAEKGTLKIGGQYLNELEYFEVKDMEKPILSIGNGPNNYGNYSGTMSNHDKIYENVLKALDNDQHPFLEATEAFQSVALIESLYLASTT